MEPPVSAHVGSVQRVGGTSYANQTRLSHSPCSFSFIRSQCSAAVQSKFTFNAFPTTNVLSNLSLKPSFAVPLVWLYEQEATSEVRAAFGERQTEMRSAKNLNIAAHVLAHAERGRRRNITAALQEKRNMQTGKSRSLFRHFLDLASHNSHC